MTETFFQESLEQFQETCYTHPNALQCASQEGIIIDAEETLDAHPREWLTVQEVARLRKVSAQAIHEAMDRERLKYVVSYKTKGGQEKRLIRKDWAMAWDAEVANRGKRRGKKPKTEKPGRQELILAAS